MRRPNDVSRKPSRQSRPWQYYMMSKTLGNILTEKSFSFGAARSDLKFGGALASSTTQLTLSTSESSPSDMSENMIFIETDDAQRVGRSSCWNGSNASQEKRNSTPCAKISFSLRREEIIKRKLTTCTPHPNAHDEVDLVRERLAK